MILGKKNLRTATLQNIPVGTVLVILIIDRNRCEKSHAPVSMRDKNF